MKLLYRSSLCLLLCLSYAIATETTEAPNKHKTTSTTPQASTTHSTTTAEPSSTTPASTTSASTTVSTTPSTSSTTSQTTTTQASTSPPSPTTAPPTTPSPPSSTTPSPATKDDWVVINPKTNNPCIIASMNITFKLHANVSQDFKITRANATAEGGSCGINSNSTQSLRLVWPFEKVNSSFVINFSEKDKNFFISGLNLSLAYNSSEDIKIAEFSSVNLTLFGTSVNSSYFCDSAEFPKLKNAQNEVVDIQVSALWIEAFKTGNSSSFSQTHYCPGEVPDIVPLVVGICLAGLVLVVVIAYLIGRRRSQASGYLSM